jgi:hypothetical protein
MDRPDYVKCVLLGNVNTPKTTWCGRQTDFGEWTFTGATHASLNARNEDRLLCCRACAEAIAKVLVEHSYGGR